jgi:hypothetical protein
MTEITREVSETSTIHYGKVIVGTSPVRLSAPITGDATGKRYRGVLITSVPGNTAVIYIGDGQVSASTGFPIQVGGFVELPVDDESGLWIVSTDVDQEVRWVAV